MMSSENCKPAPEVVDIVRAMARNRVAAGVTDPSAVIDAIHDAIHADTALWKSEIADIVTGAIGKPKEPLSALQQRMNQLKRELRKQPATRPGDSGRMQGAKASPQDRTRQTQLRKDIDALRERIANGDYVQEPNKRAAVRYNDETKHLLAERERLRRQVDTEIRRIEQQNRSPARKLLDASHSLMHAAILSSPTVFEHLAGASAWRLVSTVLEDALDTGLRTVSKSYRKLSNTAPIEGGGFQLGGHLEGLKAAFGPAAWKAMKDKLTHGMSDRAVLYGGKDAQHTSGKPLLLFAEARQRSNVLNYPLLEIVGKIHDVVKTPIEHYAFARAFYRGGKNMRRQLAVTGMDEAAIDKAMVTDSAQAALAARAYESSLAAKLQGENKVVDAYNQALRRLEDSGDFGAAMAALLRFETPIVRIPFNYASEAFSYIGGGAKAASKLGQVARDVKLKKRKPDLTPDEADYVVRNLKKQGVGAGLLALGFFGYEHFGGLYRKGRDQPNKEIPVGDAEFDGVELSHHVTHSPMWGVMQAGALMHYALLEDLRKAHEQGDAGAQLRAATGAVGQGVMALLMDVPIVDIVSDAEKLGQGGKGAARLAGKKVAQYIPGFLQWWARSDDVDESGEPIKRDPQGFTDELKMALPGYREEVPVKKHRR